MSRKELDINRYRQRTSSPTAIFTGSSQCGHAERARRWCTRWQLEQVTSTLSLVDRDSFSILLDARGQEIGNRQYNSPRRHLRPVSPNFLMVRASRVHVVGGTGCDSTRPLPARSLARSAVDG